MGLVRLLIDCLTLSTQYGYLNSKYTHNTIRNTMAQQGQLSACCVSGHVHEGTPKGKVETIAGLNTYVSPSSDGSKAKTVIFITDIFGYELVNVRLVADEYAAQ